MGRLRSQLRFGVLSLTHRQSATRLLAERQALVAELERARDDYLGGHAEGQALGGLARA